AERKIAAWAQDRIGPNRVGREFGLPFGLLQPIADGLKFLLKEQVIPGHVDRLFYLLAPCIAVSAALMALAVVPFGATTPAPTLLDRRGEVHRPAWPATISERKAILEADREWARLNGKASFEQQAEEYGKRTQFVIAPHLDIGLVYVLAVGSLGAYAIVLAGWSSNNKYSMLGSLRSSAQLISYEIPMGMSILGVMIITGSLNPERIVQYQAENGWNILFQPLAALLFVTSIFAETNRVPFDLPEAEQELVGGFHTEYSGMKFALFFLGEYTHMIATSFLAVALFFGGWHLPWLTSPEMGGWGDLALKVAVFGLKMVAFVLFYMFIRWTLPRFRFDQLMGLAWKVMIPLALASVVAVMYVKHFDLSPWLLLPASLAILVGGTALSLRVRSATAPRVRVVLEGHPVTGGRSRVE
ncbi:MAG: NADH-quinone oxidoreductase subunit NuoH, partial [Gemmataceae bacterium]|nr:NADH-quinone oxidoreductase subunit NuoH [Gemmataceae bacterium]